MSSLSLCEALIHEVPMNSRPITESIDAALKITFFARPGETVGGTMWFVFQDDPEITLLQWIRGWR